MTYYVPGTQEKDLSKVIMSLQQVAYKADTALSSVGSGSRTLLTANKSYYVRTDGSDSNDGSANDAAHAFLTIQKAVDTACALDLGVYTVTINIAAGTYTGQVVLKSYVGNGPISIVGDTTTPSNVIISVTSNSAILADGVRGPWQLSGVKLTTTTSGHLINLLNGSNLTVNGKIELGAAASGYSQFTLGTQATLNVTANYTVSGGAFDHALVSTLSLFNAHDITITISGSPTITNWFRGTRVGGFAVFSNVYSGSPAAGTKKYSITAVSFIETGGAAASIPGTVAGTNDATSYVG